MPTRATANNLWTASLICLSAHRQIPELSQIRIHPELVECALNEGTAVLRELWYVPLRAYQFAAAQEPLRAEKLLKVTTRTLGCPVMTLARMKKQMRSQKAV